VDISGDSISSIAPDVVEDYRRAVTAQIGGRPEIGPDVRFRVNRIMHRHQLAALLQSVQEISQTLKGHNSATLVVCDESLEQKSPGIPFEMRLKFSCGASPRG